MTLIQTDVFEPSAGSATVAVSANRVVSNTGLVITQDINVVGLDVDLIHTTALAVSASAATTAISAEHRLKTATSAVAASAATTVVTVSIGRNAASSATAGAATVALTVLQSSARSAAAAAPATVTFDVDRVHNAALSLTAGAAVTALDVDRVVVSGAIAVTQAAATAAIKQALYSLDLTGLWGYAAITHAVSEPEAQAVPAPPLPLPIVTYTDPNANIVSIVADASHVVVATANAGPTNVGDVFTWWEIEYVRDNAETVIQVDYGGPYNFAVNRNHSDTFTIPNGLDFSDKRIRFVIQSVIDGTLVWKSAWRTLPDTDAFNNDPPISILVPTAPAQTVNIAQVLNQKTALAKRAAEARRTTLQVRRDSRYKKATAHSGDRGTEFSLLPVLEDFYSLGSQYRVHVVEDLDIGFLDRVAVRYYGPGNERFWWAIAYANAIVDQESDLTPGQILVVPPREAIQSFITSAAGE